MILYYIILYYIILYYIILYYIISYHIISYHIISYHILYFIFYILYFIFYFNHKIFILFLDSSDSGLNTPNESRISAHFDMGDKLEDQVSTILEKEMFKYSAGRSILSQLCEDLESVKKEHSAIVTIPSIPVAFTRANI